MNRLSTHILDTSRGKPAAGVPIRLYADEREISSSVTDDDGRCPNLVSEALKPGVYRILFEVAKYFPDGLYPVVIIVFKVSEDVDHYHIPLLISPFGYTTYRGS
jgi:5-hydroxyisourate hydrolase